MLRPSDINLQVRIDGLFLGIIATMQAAIFLDRDGVIIENRPDYVRSWSDVHIYPQALAALRRAAACPYHIVIVTNQSAVGRGILTQAAADAINNQLVSIIRQAGGRIDGVYMCPHAPEEHCSCRKPQPGLLQQAASDFELDIRRSILIGDALSDILAGQNAGVARTIMVRTGRGVAQARLALPEGTQPFEIFDDLSAALQAIL